MLFNLFVTDLDQIFDEIINKNVSSLPWADDLLLVGTSRNGIQIAMNKTAEYYQSRCLSINHKTRPGSIAEICTKREREKIL